MALSTDDVQFMVSEKGSRWAYDYRRTEEEAKALAAKLTDENGKVYQVETFDDFSARRKAETLAEFTLAEITEDFYEQMLNCLPPMHREGAMGFFTCEMTSGTITSQFVRYNGLYFGASVDLADRETWITPKKIDALAVAAPLTWFPKERGQ